MEKYIPVFTPLLCLFCYTYIGGSFSELSPVIDSFLQTYIKKDNSEEECIKKHKLSVDSYQQTDIIGHRNNANFLSYWIDTTCIGQEIDLMNKETATDSKMYLVSYRTLNYHGLDKDTVLGIYSILEDAMVMKQKFQLECEKNKMDHKRYNCWITELDFLSSPVKNIGELVSSESFDML